MPSPPRIAVVAGDSIGPDVTRQTLRIVEWFARRRGFDCEIQEIAYGAANYVRTGIWLSEEGLADIVSADAVLFGSIGSGPVFEKTPIELRRRFGAISLRKAMKVFANLRPITAMPSLAEVSPLRPEIVGGTDMLMIRELSAGLYTGQPRGVETLDDGQRRSTNTQSFTSAAIHRIARIAFAAARRRKGHVLSVDKANALESGMHWREEVTSLRDAAYPDVALSHMFVDSCAIELMRDPRQFDVVLLDNMFGDILSDEASNIVGSVGLLPSASLGERDAEGRLPALYEPLHESSHDLAGKDIANPIGSIRCFAMALDFSFNRRDDARLLEKAVEHALAAGARTADIARGEPALSTSAMADAVLKALDHLHATGAVGQPAQ